MKKTLNAYAHSVDLENVGEGEVTLSFSLTRKAPKGAGSTVGKGTIQLKMTIPSWLLVRIAARGKEGLNIIAEQAQRHANNQAQWVESLRKAVA